MIHQDLTTWFDSSVNIDETYIEGHPCLDDLTSLDEAFSRSISERQGTSWYSILHELLFQDELTLYGRQLKDELDLPYPSITTIIILHCMVIVCLASFSSKILQILID